MLSVLRVPQQSAWSIDMTTQVARELMSEVGGSSAFQKLQARSTMKDLYNDVIKDSQNKVWTEECMNHPASVCHHHCYRP